MTTILTYDAITLDSSEIKSISIERNVQVNTQDTMVLYELSQAGTLKCNRINIEAEIRQNASAKFSQWYNKIAEKPTASLSAIFRTWGNYLLEKVAVNITDLAPDGDILIMSLSLSFVEYINFE